MKSRERVRHPGILLIYIEEEKKKDKHITNPAFQYVRLFDQLRFACRDFYCVFFPIHKAELANLK